MTEIIASSIALLVLVGYLIGIYTKAMTAIGNLSEETNTKRSRVYQRIDEEKKKSDDKYTSKEVCILRHEQIENTLKTQNAILDELRTDMKKLLAKAGIA